ncbi:hypothetical protein O7626_39885 [Micromonospora sp. WMMD1102]|uniref:hypothetical protein n=1 Tax=Micromonospora sp. WMMD1102 TaxID=3016105 RepID=UPI002414E240|nr:hypothetical protein [Micromonospora sp. WMMD1102]MDG4791977.1 hypothetical protein [Micromonospora sp. WMMD1102]
MTAVEPVGKPCIWGGADPCGEPGRLHLGGWYCGDHDPRALRGRQQGAVRRLVRPVERQAA